MVSKTDLEKEIDWIFDEVKSTSGLMWNAQNDNFRGLCCGTTGSASDLKDLLNDLLSETNEQGKDDSSGIFCYQWLARNPFSSTLMAEFFYNNGSLDGNEIMRQFLIVSTSAAIAGLTTVGLLSDMGGGNERFYSLMNDGKQIDIDDMWPEDNAIFTNPVDSSPNMPKIHACSCSTHGLKNIRRQLEKSRHDGSGTRQFIDGNGIPYGWWIVKQSLQRDKDRQAKNGTARTHLTNQAVYLDSFNTMRAGLAKAVFSDKSISEVLCHCADVLKVKLHWEAKSEGIHTGERLHRLLVQLKNHRDTSSNYVVDSEIAYLEFGIAVHRIYNERLMNARWNLRNDNIDEEEKQIKDALGYFHEWRTAVSEYKKNDESIKLAQREKWFISLQTYWIMKFSVCGFVTNAKYKLSKMIVHISPMNSPEIMSTLQSLVFVYCCPLCCLFLSSLRLFNRCFC